MKKQFIDILSSYLYGWKTLRDCAEWLAGINWDDLELDSETLDLIGTSELILTEVIEGLRSESEFFNLAKDFVSKNTDTYIIIRQVTANSTVNNTSDNVIFSMDLVGAES
jgi:hypothetical protein